MKSIWHQLEQLHNWNSSIIKVDREQCISDEHIENTQIEKNSKDELSTEGVYNYCYVNNFKKVCMQKIVRKNIFYLIKNILFCE